MSSPLPPSSPPLEKRGLQDWGGLNVSRDSTSTLFLLFFSGLLMRCVLEQKKVVWSKRRLFGECIWDERGLSPHLHPPNWGCPPGCFSKDASHNSLYFCVCVKVPGTLPHICRSITVFISRVCPL